MTTYTAQELSRILSQPGYAISGGSSLPTTATQRHAVAIEPANTVKHTGTPEKRRSAVLWASEREFARAVATERDIRATLHVEYRLLHHIPNENSHREPGLLVGCPDWHLPVARGGYHGFWMELKIGKNQPSPMQVAVMNMLRMEGHYCVVVWDDLATVFDECERYLGGAD